MKAAQHGAVTTINIDDVCFGWEQWLFFTSDNHFDSIYCNRETLRDDFERAQARRARVYVFGDWFDAMQGRFDPRRSMAELRPEYRRDDYYDFVVKDSADWLEPYAENIDVLADGNHCLAVLKAANTNLMDRLTAELNRRKGTHIQHGGYGGWIRFLFDQGNHKQSVKVKYFHGSGGEAPVTRGVIQTNRQAVYLPDADIVVNGHSHNAYYVPVSRERLGGKGALFFDIQHFIRCPGYKQSYGDGSTGWDVTRGGVPKPIGSWWVRLFEQSEHICIEVQPCIHEAQPVSVASDDIYDGRTYDEDDDRQE